jgi:hypothetical protein
VLAEKGRESLLERKAFLDGRPLWRDCGEGWNAGKGMEASKLRWKKRERMIAVESE